MSSLLVKLVVSLLVLRNVSGDVCLADTEGECQCNSAPPQLPTAPRFCLNTTTDNPTTYTSTTVKYTTTVQTTNRSLTVTDTTTDDPTTYRSPTVSDTTKDEPTSYRSSTATDTTTDNPTTYRSSTVSDTTTDTPTTYPSTTLQYTATDKPTTNGSPTITDTTTDNPTSTVRDETTFLLTSNGVETTEEVLCGTLSIPCGNDSCDSWTQKCDLSNTMCVCRFDPDNFNPELQCPDPCFERCDRATQICFETDQGFVCRDNCSQKFDTTTDNPTTHRPSTIQDETTYSPTSDAVKTTEEVLCRSPSIPCGNDSCDSWTQKCDLSNTKCVCRFDPTKSDPELCIDPCFERCNRTTQICLETDQGFECRDDCSQNFADSRPLHIAKRDVSSGKDNKVFTGEEENPTIVFVLVGVCLGGMMTSAMLFFVVTRKYRKRSRKRMLSFRDTDSR